MRLYELFDNDTTIVDKIQSTIVDYLAALNAAGATTIPKKKVIDFLRTQGFDVAETQIDSVLDKTSYGTDGDLINLEPESQDEDFTDDIGPPPDDISPPPPPEDNEMDSDVPPEENSNDDLQKKYTDQKVKNMAQNQIAKGVLDD
jgi:hypothetical protein